MIALSKSRSPATTITLYPWFKFWQSLIFWQAVWFLYFQNQLSAAEAILLYAVYDVSATILEVPSGYMSDRLGRRLTLILASLAAVLGMGLLAVGGSLAVFVAGQILIGASQAFASGTDSSLLYESLDAEGRSHEIEAQEVRAWRFSFVALAVSAVSGGAMAMSSQSLPYVASSIAGTFALLIAFQFDEPKRLAMSEAARFRSLLGAFRQPILLWLFALGVVMYIYSHIPFVFGQPYILDALESQGLAAEAPLVSGGVTAIMMGLSVTVSLFAPKLRGKIGLTAMLLGAFAMQIALAGVMALTNSAIAIAFLFLRMVPDSLSTPFIMARIQPILGDESRATYLSLKSLTGRLAFSATLFAASLAASDVGELQRNEMQSVLTWYVVAGLVALVILSLAARRLSIEPQSP
ncbi:MAG: MFS transporter [Pseudomonadota bacterium]